MTDKQAYRAIVDHHLPVYRDAAAGKRHIKTGAGKSPDAVIGVIGQDASYVLTAALFGLTCLDSCQYGQHDPACSHRHYVAGTEADEGRFDGYRVAASVLYPWYAAEHAGLGTRKFQVLDYVKLVLL